MLKNKRYIITAAMLVLSFLVPSFASATTLNQAGVRLGRLGASAGSGGAGDGNDMLVTFKLNTTPTSVAKITITFPASFTLTNGTPTPTTTNFPSTPGSITAPPGTLASTVDNTAKTIVVTGLTSASLDNTTLYGFFIPAGSIQNPASAGQYNVTVESDPSSGPAIDSSFTPVYITSTGTGDQVTVHASVAPTFSFSLSANTDTVPSADPSSTQTSPGVTMTVGTNSPLGYTAYVKSANAALTSATSPATPIGTGTFDGTPDALTNGTTNYGFVPSTGTACTSCTGSLTYNGEYAVADGTHAGAFNSTNFAPFVSRSGYTNADQISLKERVTVANTIGYANDYIDTLTVVAAGNF